MIDPKANPVVHATTFRRVIAVVMLAGLGVFLLFLAFGEQSVGFIWKVVFALIGAGALILTGRLWDATKQSIHLTEAGLVETSGRVLCAFDNIEAIETSAFSFKPTNGILIRMRTPMPSTWAPGLWWRYGRKVGIGGVTSAGEAKAMADILALRRLEAAERADSGV